MKFSESSSDFFYDNQLTNEVLNLDHLELLAIQLAKDLAIQTNNEKINLLSEVKVLSKQLLHSYFLLAKDISHQNITPASEWFLDNFHIIEEQLRSIKRDLPKNFYHELPKVSQGQFAGYPRVYAITYTYILNTDSALDLNSIKNFVKAFQTVTPLTIGELWAIAITFRISLIKKLHPLVDRIIFARQKRKEGDELADKVLDLATKRNTTPDHLIEYLSKKIDPKFNRPFTVQIIQRLREQDPSVTKVYEWLDRLLHSHQSSINEMVQLEHYKQAAAQVTIGNIITSMRLLSIIDWHDFFEEVSVVNEILANDPANAYCHMDRTTRDSYRKVIERISKRTSFSEIQVAQMAIECAQKVISESATDKRKKHVGYYLLDRGVLTLEQTLHYRSPFREKLVRFVDEDPSFMYFGSIILVTFFLMALVLKVFPIPENNPLQILSLLALVTIPLSDLSISFINYIITMLRTPKKLPRMETKKGIQEKDKTMVVVPCLLTNQVVIQELLNNLEVQFLANQDNHLYFSLLGDLSDAPTETTDKDQALLELTEQGIAVLNRRYQKQGPPKFYLFHRARHYNPGEEKWICWERKRGKLVEFNRLLRGNKKTTYLNQNLDQEFLKTIQYVITLDADTQLPLQNARRLIGTITHPLNMPVYCAKRNRIVAGYGILQPRISVSLLSAAKTRFSRIFSGNTGIDPYTTAVSDVYQDLFNEGSFTGKGLYVVDAFEKVIGERVPENCVLSHDLLEGSYARVGLTTDLELIDDFPANFEVYAKRQHRWTRGDWQIALWLLPFVPDCNNQWTRNNLSLISRWKIFDNLRRSLLTPATLLWLTLSWSILPGSPFLWTLTIILTMSFPVYVPSLSDLCRHHEGAWNKHLVICTHEFKKRLEQIVLMLIFMPSIAVDQIDAITRSLFRMFISRKHLLEWVTFSQTQIQNRKGFHWKEVITCGPIFSLLTLTLLLFVRPSSILIALPFLTAWSLAPWVSRLTGERRKTTLKPLDQSEIKQYRRYARMTWHFFEVFAGKKNNWLAPDNFQEDPVPMVAHRTSPTNIGLQLLSILSAYDMGYIGRHELINCLERTMKTLFELEKMNGHFYNWYDTLHLNPLQPRYISSVDSGNLAGHLIVIKQACLSLSEEPLSFSQFHEGLKDGLGIVVELIENHKNNFPHNEQLHLTQILEIIENIDLNSSVEKWVTVLEKLNQAKLIITNFISARNHDFQNIIKWFECLITQVESYQQDKAENAPELAERLNKIAATCQEIYLGMDFRFLFDEERKIFSIGFNVSEGKSDNSYYDLLASESRLASFCAIAKGDVPDQHWFHLNRQLTSVVGSRALISWSASMFEYLMPLLVMRRYEETLLDQTYESVVLRQIEYAKQRQIPWGISEAGYNARDLNFNYQYGPFGIPGLGLKRGLRDELVISPYSTMLAAMVAPRKSLENLELLERMETLGNYGFYESIDYTPQRKPRNKKFVILKSYMAHHQGMSLISINNILNKFIIQKRFHAEPRVKAVQLLLQERIPAIVQITKPRAEETHLESFARFSEDHHIRIYNDPSLSMPRTQILSNGNYSVMMTSAGSGFSKCEERMVTRWREDPTQDSWGQFIYLQDVKTQKTWSAGFQPINSKPKNYESHFSEDKIEIIRQDNEISTHTEIIISAEDNVEMRRIVLTNHSNRPVDIDITSYMEIVLARANDDIAHPAFSNLFIQTEFLPEFNSLLAHRRQRSKHKDETDLWGFHLLTIDAETVSEIQYETDRSRFLGRGRSVKNPIVMTNEIDLSKTIGAVLDPIFSLRQRVRISPHQIAKLTYSTGLVYTKAEALRVIAKYQDINIFQRQANLSWVKNQITLRHLNISSEKSHLYQRLGGRLIYLSPYLRAQSQVIISNQKNQSALWAYGISGDLPILLTRISDEKDIEMVRELLHAYEYLKLKGLKFDLVILNEHATSYLQNLQDELMKKIMISGLHSYLDKPGGVFIRRSDLIPSEDLVLLSSVARVVLFASKGTLAEQLKRRPYEMELPPSFIPTVSKKTYSRLAFRPVELVFFNSLGGFTPDGREYVITLRGEQWTPAPWINVISNKNNFGFIISEAGSGYSWSVNSRENRISSWSNDAVSDPTSEIIYLRDEESGAFWSPTPLPLRNQEHYLIRHGQGYSEFHHDCHGISHQMTVFADLHQPIKIIHLKLKNLGENNRKLSLISYIEWVLGFSRHQTTQTLVTTWDEKNQTLLAKNTYNNEFADYVAFMKIVINDDNQSKTFTGDRKEFIGRNNSLTNPAALFRKHLSGRTGGGLDPCGAIQVNFNLLPQQEKEIIILIGQAVSVDKIPNLLALYQSSQDVNHSLQSVKNYWEEILTTITIKTPDPAMDMLMNRWLLYQTLSCRILGRSAFYQSGGAYGYRDQLQDVMAMVYSHPEITREQIKLAASRQFPEGDVQHWWHPPTGRGVRTRISDDLLWLPFVINYYIKVTGDESILEEMISFIEAPQLTEGHDEAYTQPQISKLESTIFDHCCRAIDRSLKVGAHGLPLMGSGDWNDGMNRVGHSGLGESVWLAWFLIKIMRDFIPFCLKLGDRTRAQSYLTHVEKLKNSIESHAWDGEWYLRAYFDDGEKLGSNKSDECKIDAIAQSWSLISGEGNEERSKKALTSVNQYLINRQEQIIKLFTPPFDKSTVDPGYIKGYVPGVRENGGQYTHAAIWTIMAYAALKDGQTATELFSLINPINRSATLTGAQKYKIEPFVIAADIYGVSPHVGRGGWSWYTGSSSWMYRAGLESLLGFSLHANRLTIDPCIPASWEQFSITYRRGKTIFNITLLNNQNDAAIEVDHKVIDGTEIILVDDQREHNIVVKRQNTSSRFAT